MDVWLIWAIVNQGTLDENISVQDAWDADTREENPSGFEEKLHELYEEFGAQNIRVTKISVDFDKVQAAFQPVDISEKPQKPLHSGSVCR